VSDRIVSIDQRGKLQCISAKAVAAVPSDFITVLNTLCNDMQLALDCLDQFGGVPLPVARAILRNMEPAHDAIDMCVRMAGSQKVEMK
jgi:hypothetical protein